MRCDFRRNIIFLLGTKNRTMRRWLCTCVSVTHVVFRHQRNQLLSATHLLVLGMCGRSDTPAWLWCVMIQFQVFEGRRLVPCVWIAVPSLSTANPKRMTNCILQQPICHIQYFQCGERVREQPLQPGVVKRKSPFTLPARWLCPGIYVLSFSTI